MATATNTKSKKIAASPAAPARPAIENPAQEVFVSFSAEVVPNTSETLIAVVAQQVANGAKIVHLLLSTPGGNVMNGMNVYNMLRALPVHLITHNAGNVDSIGNAIFLAGAERQCCKHSTFMFHGVGFDIAGQFRFEEKLLRERLGGIESDQRRIGEIMRERTSLDAKTIKSLFLEASTKDSTYALANGIVHKICDINIPQGHPVIQLVFQR